jgi:hypothetical protein
VPVKCSVLVRYVFTVTYHEPQIAYSRNIIAARRVFTSEDIDRLRAAVCSLRATV